MSTAPSLPDLTAIDGATLTQARDQLRAQGYREQGGLFAHPGRPGHIVRLSDNHRAAAGFAAIARLQPDNPYLPCIFATHAAPGAFITVMEKLENVRARTDDTRTPLTGVGRALTLLLEGEANHAAVHEYMLKNGDLRAAVQAIARAIADSGARADGEALVYDCGMNTTLELTQQETDTILFRIEEEGGARPVFVAPFATVTLAGNAERAAHAAHAAAVTARAGLPPPRLYKLPTPEI
jgi:hypothetical protein